MAKSANLIYSRHFTITASASGTETGTVVGVKTRGILDTLVIRKTAGSATYADVEVRLKTGNNNAEYLIYEETAASGAAATLPVRETNIGALFDTLSDDSDDDLYIYLLPRTASGASGATTGTFAVRMDFRIQQ
jgi:hypothetical protein